MVFCNRVNKEDKKSYDLCHNPYFNRWFSAITDYKSDIITDTLGHNPYFNRWFSAMHNTYHIDCIIQESQSLF